MMKLTALARRLLTLSQNRAPPEWDRCLPVEILEKVYGHLLEERDASPTSITFMRKTLQPTLRVAALVCRVWYEVATKHLYSEIYLSSSKALDLLATALKKYDHLRPLVYDFHFTGKLYEFGELEQPFTLLQAYNHDQILSLCPNIRSFRGTGMDLPVLCEENYTDPVTFPAMELDPFIMARLTFLELLVPERVLFSARLSTSVVFPELRTLILICPFHCGGYGEIQWFRMPQLRRLVMKDFFWPGYECNLVQEVSFPEYSPLIHTIELLGGIYYNSADFFSEKNSPLLRYRKTLQSLTITAISIGFSDRELLTRRRWDWSLGFLESLVELCLPFYSFARVTAIISYPPRLRELVLIGHKRCSYMVKPIERDWGKDRLEDIFLLKEEGVLPDLKRVRVLVRDLEKDISFRLLSEMEAKRATIDLRLGVRHLYGRKDRMLDTTRTRLKEFTR